jgi:hypothetical protein
LNFDPSRRYQRLISHDTDFISSRSFSNIGFYTRASI